MRILIADDHVFYREGVRALLAGDKGIEIAGEAANGDQAITAARELQPHVVLMDLRMPGLNGIDATRQIVAENTGIAVLVVTMFDDDDSVFAAMRAGARGYLLKDADQDELLRALRAVHRGEAIFSPAIARRMVRYFGALHDQPSAPFPQLTEREREILALIAQSYSNQAIAARLVLSIKTVQNHVSNIFGKPQVADRAEAIARARCGPGRAVKRRTEAQSIIMHYPHSPSGRPPDRGTDSFVVHILELALTNVRLTPCEPQEYRIVGAVRGTATPPLGKGYSMPDYVKQ